MSESAAQELERTGLLDVLERVYRFAELNAHLRLRDEGRLALSPEEVHAILAEMSELTGAQLHERASH
jgi:hypothetical protein